MCSTPKMYVPFSALEKLKVHAKSHLLNTRSHMAPLLMRHMQKWYVVANISFSTVPNEIMGMYGSVVCLLALPELTVAFFFCRHTFHTLFANIFLHSSEKHESTSPLRVGVSHFTIVHLALPSKQNKNLFSLCQTNPFRIHL